MQSLTRIEDKTLRHITHRRLVKECLFCKVSDQLKSFFLPFRCNTHSSKLPSDHWFFKDFWFLGYWLIWTVFDSYHWKILWNAWDLFRKFVVLERDLLLPVAFTPLKPSLMLQTQKLGALASILLVLTPHILFWFLTIWWKLIFGC